MLKKTKRLMLLLPVLLIFFLLGIANVNAANVTTCTLVNPSPTNQYDNGVIKLNTTAIWNTISLNESDGVSNVTFIFYGNGTTTVFSNSTANGTRTNATAGATALTAQYTFTLVDADLADNVVYSVVSSCYDNVTDSDAKRTLNSSVATYTVDTINPAVTIQKPNQGETISSKGEGKVPIDFTATDTNLGNATYYINGVQVSSSTSGTTSSNLTSGSRKNYFTKFFGSNNNSITLIVEITDLAGRKTNSSTTTFSVFTAGAAEPVTVFVTPSGEIISTPAQPKGKAITKPIALGNIGNVGNLLSNPLVWGGIIVVAVVGFIWWQNRKKS